MHESTIKVPVNYWTVSAWKDAKVLLAKVYDVRRQQKNGNLWK
jgi:hypothetical protein